MASEASDPVFEQIKEEYMAPIFREIRAQAQKKCGPDGLKATDVVRAFEDYFGGLPRQRRSMSQFVQDNIFLLAAIFLTLVFGAFGLYHPDDQDVASFLDIAKIFAGAVVGGAAGSSVVSMTRRRAPPPR